MVGEEREYASGGGLSSDNWHCHPPFNCGFVIVSISIYLFCDMYVNLSFVFLL